MKKVVSFVSVLAIVGLLCLLPAVRGGAENQSVQPVRTSPFKGEILVLPQGRGEVIPLSDTSVEQLFGRSYLVGKYCLRHGNPSEWANRLWVPITNDTRFIDCSDYDAHKFLELVRQRAGEGVSQLD